MTFNLLNFKPMQQPPKGLLGPYYDPAEERRQKIFGAMSAAGAALLGNGQGNFGQVIGQGLAGANQGAQQAGQNYRNDAMLYSQMAQQNADRERQIGMENTKMGWTLEDRAKADAQAREQERLKTNQTAAIMDWANKKPPEFQAWAKNFPEDAAKVYATEMDPAAGVKPTDDIAEYNFAKSQGFTGTLQDWIVAGRKAGATTIDMTGADGNFDKELSKGVAGAYIKQMEIGQNAVATKTAAQQLRVLMKDRGGALDGLTAAAAPYLPEGIIPEGANDIVAAQAIVSGLIPKQRVPGSGTTSDFDARKFAESLPSMWNKPGANEIITSTMESYADYQIAISNVIADIASNPDIKNKSAAIREEIAKIPDPFIGWKQYMSSTGMMQSGVGKTNSEIDSLVNKYRSK